MTVWMAQPGHYRAVFSLDRPPLLADRQLPLEENLKRAEFHVYLLCAQRFKKRCPLRVTS